MRPVIWTDDRGYRRRNFIKDDHDDAMARHGIPGDPPSVDDLDWEAIKRDLHNALVDRSLINYNDIRGNVLNGVILHAMRRRLIALYKERRGK